MPIRSEVEDLVSKGPLPSEAEASVAALESLADAMQRITGPVSQDEAEALIACFGPDECYGLAWSLLHLIETAPRLPEMNESVLSGSEWLRLVWNPGG